MTGLKRIAKFFTQNDCHANMMVIDGGMRRGKTNVACLIIESLIKDFNFDVMTNIRFKRGKKPKRTFYITQFSDFLRTYAKNIKGNSVTIIDDAQVTFGQSTGAMSKKGKDNSKFILYIGKFQTNLIYISHILEYMPRNIYTFDPLVIQASRRDIKGKDRKIIKKNFMITVNNKTYNWIPSTKLEYETFSPPSWEYDIRPGVLYRELAQVYQDEIKEAILQFLDNNVMIDDKFCISRTEQIKIILKFLGNDKTYTQTEIAKRLGVNQSLISKTKMMI